MEYSNEPQQQQQEPGTLVSIGRRNLGAIQRYEYFRCTSCGTEYPRIDWAIRCNGQPITRCICTKGEA